MAVGRLPLESRIRPDKLFTLKQTLAVKTLGRVKSGVSVKQSNMGVAVASN